MNDKNFKWLCGSMCLLSVIFGVISERRYRHFFWLIHGTSGRSFILFGNMIINVLFFVMAIYLLLVVFRGRYQRMALVYGALAVGGVACFIPRAPYILEGISSIFSLCYIFQGLLISSIAICLIISLKKRQKMWINVILVQLVILPIVISVGEAGVTMEVFQYVPVLIAGLIINMKIIENAKYDDTTSALESLKKQYESGIISNEEYTLKKSELISKL